MLKLYHAKLLGLPPLASEHGRHVDNLIIYVHWLMIALFVGWLAYFALRAVPLPPRAQSRRRITIGVRSHASSYLEVAVAVRRRRAAGRSRHAALGQGGGQVSRRAKDPP